MVSAQAKTIQIFLPTGEPRGIRIAELTTRIVQAVLIPRSELATAKQREELDQNAVYFLFGESENAAKPIVYIGQTEEIRKRLDYHNSNKDFWRTAVLITSRTQSFTQAHIRHLEWYCITKGKEVNRFEVENDQTPGKPKIPEPIEADLLEVFETLSVLVSTLGFPVFEPITKTDAQEKFYCRGPDADAEGELVEDGFVVRKGSKARLDIVASATEIVTAKRQQLIEGGVLKQEKKQLIFTEDYLFSSPSAGSTVVLGRSSNGWLDWKDKDGRTLHEVKRAGTLAG
jgi:hypothetical protein